MCGGEKVCLSKKFSPIPRLLERLCPLPPCERYPNMIEWWQMISCAALESLIGFFVGVIFVLGGVFLCIIQC